ncbi:MAG: sterol desaturase family protein [Phaeodactylibacter sp.]|nr:sterol desaturase family protein [Phaeodactylibacter sp.]
MPTPLEILLGPISLVAIATYLGLMAWEARYPARELPYVRHWKLKGLLSFGVYFYLSSYLPLLIDPVLLPYRLFDLAGLGTVGGAAAGILLYEFVLYFWHRSLHRSDLLWRTFHQMHHSAERLDTYGAFFFSPLDMAGLTTLGSICFALIVGLSPQAITVVLLGTNFLGIFQHANIRTPHWLGYLIQRPESHTVHHAQGIHRHNYSDLPIFDILFNTFYNPNGYEHETGFYPGSTSRIVDMLLFRDISQSPDRAK